MCNLKSVKNRCQIEQYKSRCATASDNHINYLNGLQHTALSIVGIKNVKYMTFILPHNYFFL